jgi:lipopolysaccharide assembly protein A
MRFVTWTVRLILFVFLVALAAKNVEPVTLRFYFDLALRAPLVVVVFAAFALGALFGVLALLTTVLRQKHEISQLRRRKPEVPSATPPTVPPI